METTNGKRIRYFSMFTGVGGFELGLQRANDNQRSLISKESKQKEREQGREWTSNEHREELCTRQESSFCCVGFSEIDKFASKLLAEKFPSIKNYGDATKIIPSELPEFDFLCGGFPCQAFSIAGKRRGFEDTRGTLFFQIVRVLQAKRPRIVFLENVKGLLNHEGGKTFTTIISTLDELGYDVQWMVLNSKFFGVPQNRERVFIIGNLRGTPRPEILPFRESNQETLPESEVSHTLISGYGKIARGTTMINEIELFQQSEHQQSRIYGLEGVSPTLAGASKLSGDCTPKLAIPVLTPDREEKRQNGRRFKEDGEESFTLTNQDKHGIFDGAKIRKLTPIECERLQGFPDNWTKGFSDNQRYKMMGNAVTVNVIAAVAEKLFSNDLKGGAHGEGKAGEVKNAGD